jgi:uncharacterized protein YaaQ
LQWFNVKMPATSSMRSLHGAIELRVSVAKVVFCVEGNVTLLIAVEDEHIDAVMRLIHTHCHMRVRYISPLPPVAESGEFYPPTPVEVQVGGATVFVLNAESVTRVLN